MGLRVSVSLEKIFELRRLGYQMSPVKVVFKSSLSSIKLSFLEIDNVLEGSTMTVPMWVANVLAKHGMVEIFEEGFDEEFFRSVAKEKLLRDSVMISQLSDEFYLHLIDFLEKKRSEAPSDVLSRSSYQKVHNDAQDLVSIRIRKLLHYARTYSDASDILPKMTLEEKMLLQSLQKLVQDFTSSIFEEGA
jgi:hypothetical protein